MKKSRQIILLIMTILLMTSIACRATGRVSQRLNQNEATSSNEIDFSVGDGESETAVSPQSSDTDTLGDDFESLLDGLIHENDQADSLEDFPTFEN